MWMHGLHAGQGNTYNTSSVILWPKFLLAWLINAWEGGIYCACVLLMPTCMHACAVPWSLLLPVTTVSLCFNETRINWCSGVTPACIYVPFHNFCGKFYGGLYLNACFNCY